MRTRGRTYHETRLTESERAVALWCPRGCGEAVPMGQKCTPCAVAAVEQWKQTRAARRS